MTVYRGDEFTLGRRPVLIPGVFRFVFHKVLVFRDVNERKGGLARRAHAHSRGRRVRCVRRLGQLRGVLMSRWKGGRGGSLPLLLGTLVHLLVGMGTGTARPKQLVDE